MRLLSCISPHGYGHAAQTAAVLAELRARRPGLELRIETRVPQAFLAGRLGTGFEYHRSASDFGLVMHSALAIDLPASASRYRQDHAGWEARVAAEARRLEALAPDLILADVPYLPLAAAALVGIPALALCSLNWAGIYRHYFGGLPEAGRILREMIAAYSSAACFLRPAPALPMPELDRVRDLAPIARLAGNSALQCRRDLDRRLGLNPEARLVMIAPGGFDHRLPVEDWPRRADRHWIVPDDWGLEREDVTAFGRLGLGFTEVLAGCDAVLGKIGYGTVTECACNGTPLLYLGRPDWVEEPYLVDWLRRNGRCAEVAVRGVETGDLETPLAEVLSAGAPPRPAPDGAAQAAEVLSEWLR